MTHDKLKARLRTPGIGAMWGPSPFEEAADAIERLEADNARLRRDRETLLTFAQAIQTWRSDADSYDRECEHPQRNYCEDVELIEKAAGYALRRVAERAALQETSR